jgi:DNA-binding CsgD family transcriptional regulator
MIPEELIMSDCGSTLAFPQTMLAPPPAFALPAEPAASDLIALSNRLNCGAIILQRDGDIAAMNANAQDLMGDGLLLAQGRLSIISRPHQDLLEDMLRKAFCREQGGPACMSLPRRSGKRPLLLQVVPLTRPDALDGALEDVEPNPAVVLLLVFDFEHRPCAACSAALRALGLTPAEAAVASLVGAGVSPQDASDRLGISVLTVRTHLKAIFQKLGLQRQGDLVRIVSRLTMVG